MSAISKILMKYHLNVHHSNNNRIWRRIATTTGPRDRLFKIKFVGINPGQMRQFTDDPPITEIA